MPDLLYLDDLVLCGESEEDPKAMVGHMVDVSRSLKVMVLGGEEGLECEVCVDRIR